MKNKIYYLLLFVLLITACTPNNNNPTPTPTGNSIYVGGYATNSNNIPVAVYWKDSTLVTLGSGTTESFLSDLTIYGNDVYACGYEGMNNTIAVYWKNGTAHNLSNATTSNAKGIEVDGDTVWVGGNENITGNRAVVWRNGTGSYLTPEASWTKLSDISRVNGKIYTCGTGRYPLDDMQTIFIWKGSSIIYFYKDANGISNSSLYTYPQIEKMYVAADSIIYLCGWEINTSTGKKQATVWKFANGSNLPTVIHLSNGLFEAKAFDITVIGNDVFVVGFELTNTNKSIAKIWKNGTPYHNLTDGNGIGSAFSINSKNNHLFIAGSNKSGNLVNSSNLKAVRWNDTSVTNLTTGAKDAEALTKIIFN